MNEFIEKLIGRLEEEYNYQKTKAFQEGIRVGCGEEPKMISEEYNRNQNAQCFDASIQIVNELAEEYKNDVCEWRKDKIMSGMYVACSGYVTHLKDFKFCPYCGKKIKVAPYQPKGEWG